MYALIGSSSVADVRAFRSLKIYLHTRNNFWPGIDTASYIELKLNENIDARFQMTTVNRLNKAKAPCTETPGYSLTGCLMSYVEKKAGCRLDWYVSEEDLKKGN